ncbi:unnamed protein product [Microthlaspi erraticum]|uniref:Reverse transcriptase domain-containing protein n=1 Tax=Microthlaspi erraticum TaxID=1685480 RepID=A0A6D2JBD8_9BRAS|nr:unnamed protein product [Microthlaspi erraticum]
MLIPPYQKFLKDAVQQRTREAQGMVVLTRECSAIIQRKVISDKKEDLGSFTLPCMLGPLSFKNSLCDLGSSVSLMPLSVAKRLGYHKYQACGISLVLADRSIRLPTGMLEDLPLRIWNVKIPTDFIVLEMDKEPTDPLILGRPFLAAARAMIDVCEGTIELNLGKDLRMKFDIKDTMRKPTIEGQLFYVEEMDQLADELLEELSLKDPLQIALTKDSSEGYVSSETEEYKKLLDTFRPVPNILSIEGLDRPVCEVMAVSSIKSSIESGFEQANSIELGTECKEQAQGDCSELKAPKVDLKPLPEGLSYAFLGENSTYHVIVNSDLEPEQIHLEDESKSSIEPQRRLNPNLKEVVKKEILKLLDAGIIYPISDSTWISPVHCVPKKGGITVIKNDKEELIPTRTIVGHRMYVRKIGKPPFYCFLDGYSGFFQIPIHPNDQEKTTFTCPYGTFAYRRMPFGLCNAPATFQRCMTSIFSDLIEEMVEVFMDDFSVYGASFSSCLSNLCRVLQRCEETNLVLNWEKCHFMVQEGIVLGHKISEKGIELDRAKVDVMLQLPCSQDCEGHQEFSGSCRVLQKIHQGFLKDSKTLDKTSVQGDRF